jgi:cellulose 1,4-beta-cellobiosidase
MGGVVRRIITVLAAIAALVLTPAAGARADQACRLDFWTWQGGYSANGATPGPLTLSMPAGTTVGYGWNAQITTSGNQVTVAATGQFGFGGTVTGGFALPSGIPPSCAVTIDGHPAPAVVAEPGALTVPEGSSATFTVRLSAPPASGVSIGMRTKGTGVWAMPPILLTFGPTDWDRPKSMTLYAAQDADAIDDVLVVTLSAPGYLPGTVTLTQADDD